MLLIGKQKCMRPIFATSASCVWTQTMITIKWVKLWKHFCAIQSDLRPSLTLESKRLKNRDNFLGCKRFSAARFFSRRSWDKGLNPPNGQCFAESCLLLLFSILQPSRQSRLQLLVFLLYPVSNETNSQANGQLNKSMTTSHKRYERYSLYRR